MLFQRLYIDRVGRSKHLLVQIQRQDTRKNSELCPKLTIKRVESRSGVLLLTLNNFHFFSVSIVQSRFKSRLFGLLVFIAFFRK